MGGRALQLVGRNLPVCQLDNVLICRLTVDVLSFSISSSSSLSVDPMSLHCNLSLVLLLPAPLCSTASPPYSTQAGIMCGCANIVKRNPLS